jgi:hypothetical protein
MQHQRVLKAAHDHRLPPNPLAELSRAELVAAAVQRLAEMGFPEDEVAEVLPPVDEFLPCRFTSDRPNRKWSIPRNTEHLGRTMGEERAAQARLPREERWQEPRWYHDNFNTPDDLAIWPPDLDGGVNNP